MHGSYFIYGYKLIPKEAAFHCCVGPRVLKIILRSLKAISSPLFFAVDLLDGMHIMVYLRDIFEWLGSDTKTWVRCEPVYQFLGNVYPKQVLESIVPKV